MANSSVQILARWQASLSQRACSPLEFLEMVQASIEALALPEITFSRVLCPQGGWLSPRRIYLRVRCRRLFFDVSAFLAGDSLVVGWWLHEEASGIADLLAELPGIGFLMRKTTRAASYYAVDLLEYLQRAVHETILRVVDELIEERGLAPLPSAARVPVWEEIW